MEEICRVTRSKEDAKASYNRLSKWYDLLVGRTEKKFREFGIERLGVKDGQKALEIGFGTGFCTVALARAVGASGRVYGIDISEGMRDITSSRVEAAGLSERVELRCADAAKLPYESDSIDAVFTSFTLELFDTPEIPVVLKECLRVLRPGGRICIVAMSKKDKVGMMVKFYEWAHRKFPAYVDCRPIFLQRSLKDAGFDIVQTNTMSFWRIPVEIIVAGKVSA